MRREVLDPLSIDACFNWPTCSDAAVARAVVLTSDGEAGPRRPRRQAPRLPGVSSATATPATSARWQLGREWRACSRPRAACASPSAACRAIGRMLLNRGTLDGVRILSPQSVDTLADPGLALRRPQRRYRPAVSTAATASPPSRSRPRVTAAPTTPARDGALLVGHAGDAYGLRSGLWIDRARGRGIAYLRHRPRCRPAARRRAAPSGPPKPPPSAAPSALLARVSREPARAAASGGGRRRQRARIRRQDHRAVRAGLSRRRRGRWWRRRGWRRRRRGGRREIVDQAGEDAVRAELAAHSLDADIVADLAAVEVAVFQADVEMVEHRSAHPAMTARRSSCR